jgi:hypothetical protein
MTRRKPPWPRLTAAERAHARRVLAVMAVTAVVVSAAFLAAWLPGWRRSPKAEHPHRPAAHGGALVSVGAGDRHYHAEAVLGRRGALLVYTFAADAATVQEVESQVLTALVRAAGDPKPAAVDLMPLPQPDDSPGKTSRFGGRLPRAFWGRPVAVSVPEVAIAGRQFRLEFNPLCRWHHDGAAGEGDEEERKLFLTPGGKYTEADIRANGGVTAAEKYRGFQAAHDANPKRGERICPVTLTRADPACSWIVGGQKYLFCCPPCIDEFVRAAKERPEKIRDAGGYVVK